MGLKCSASYTLHLSSRNKRNSERSVVEKRKNVKSNSKVVVVGLEAVVAAEVMKDLQHVHLVLQGDATEIRMTRNEDIHVPGKIITYNDMYNILKNFTHT